ncbi:actin nucleation-promoting factor WASL-like isoform X2 [Mercenaria mercenaria]|uniref:actin nucleation-promoting factor WASL-like isoform X2 n=1 Tax=Mercenaria mercenaria TaxID=6596 RepID=UPI00234F942F|nr:actin nucleation-promoting factor WASL-like isoform X2 [Mercenaria mercenaria]
MTARPVIVNVKSRLLTDEENETIFHALGYKCRTLATTVAELYCDVGDKTKTWEKQDSGVVCFVKDFVKRSYFIRFYDRKDKTMMWEHDIRKFQGFEFTTSDGCIALTARDKKVFFLDKDEAEQFKKEIQENLTKFKARRVRRQGARNTTDAASGENAEENKPAGKTSKKEKKKITKEDIRIPTDFRHVNHVGWDPSFSNIDTKLDPQMRALFEEIGISDQSQVDKETLDFIYDFIEKHGGAEGIIAEQKDESKNRNRVRPPPPPLRGTTPTPPPPPPPNRNPDITSPAVPGTKQAISPPPPPSSGNRPPPPPSSRNRSGPPPPPSRNQPPPPPPNRNQNIPPPPPPGRYQHPPPPPGRNRTGPPPPPSGRYQPPPPPPGRNQTVPPQPPSGRGHQHPPPPPDGRRQDGPSTRPPSGGKQDEPSPHPQTAFQDVSGGATGQDNPLKQQIMQLLLHNPTEITNFIYDIVDKRGGLDFIKDKFAGGHAQTDPSQNDDNESGTGSTDIQDPRSSSDDQVPGKTSNYDQIPGRSSNGDQVPGRSSTGDEVPGRISDEKSPDFELGSDVFDDDDGEWDDLNDQIDQY